MVQWPLTTTSHAPRPAPPPGPRVAPPAACDVPASVASARREPGRLIPGSPGAGVVGTFLIGVLTFGLFPIIAWALRWSGYVAAERRHYHGVAEWLRQHSRHPSVGRFAERVAALRGRPVLSVLAVACSVLTITLFVAAFVPLGPDAPIEATYRFLPRTDRLFDFNSGNPTVMLRQSVFLAWSGLLAIAYFCHWLQVQLHARDVRRMLDEFNTVALHDGLSPVFLQPIGLGVRPLWAIGAVLLILNSAPWGVAMMLAGAVQRRYTRRAEPALSGAMACRIRDLAAIRRQAPSPAPASSSGPTTVVPKVRLRCTTDGCRMPLPAGAVFCPRCGSRAVAPLDRVA